MSTIDELARVEVTELRRTMSEGFDLDDGLERARRNESMVRVIHDRAPRRGWMAAGVAAAAAVALVGALTLRDDSSVVVDQPIETTEPAPQETSAPVTTTAAPQSTQSPTTAAPSTTESRSDDVARVVLENVVADVAPQRTVLYTAPIGNGPGELGIEECSECEGVRPWSPVRLTDGRLVIADGINRRWVIVADGQPSVVPWAGDALVITQPVVDDAGLIYAVMWQAIGKADNFRELWILDPDDMSAPALSRPTNAISNSTVLLTPAGVSVDGVLIDGVIPTIGRRPELTPQLQAQPPTIGVTWAGATTTWNVGTQYTTYLGLASGALVDGSVLIDQFRYDDTDQLIARLLPDGTAARIVVPYPQSSNGSRWADEHGILQLEVVDDHWEVAQYALPAPSASP